MSPFESQLQDDENQSSSWESTDFQWYDLRGGEIHHTVFNLIMRGMVSEPSHQWSRSMNDDRGNRAILGQQVRAPEKSTQKYHTVP